MYDVYMCVWYVVVLSRLRLVYVRMSTKSVQRQVCMCMAVRYLCLLWISGRLVQIDSGYCWSYVRAHASLSIVAWSMLFHQFCRLEVQVLRCSDTCFCIRLPGSVCATYVALNTILWRLWHLLLHSHRQKMKVIVCTYVLFYKCRIKINILHKVAACP